MSIYVKNSTINPVNCKDALVAGKLDTLIDSISNISTDDDAIKTAVESVDSKIIVATNNGYGGINVAVCNSDPIGVSLQANSLDLATESTLASMASDIAVLKNKSDSTCGKLWNPADTIVDGQASDPINSILYGSLISFFGNFSIPDNTTTVAELRVEYSFTGSANDAEWFGSNNVVSVVSGQAFNLDFWTASPYVRIKTDTTGNYMLAYGCRS